MISKAALTNPISSTPPVSTALVPAEFFGKPLDPTSSPPQSTYWSRKQAMNYSKDQKFQLGVTDKLSTSRTSGLKPYIMDTPGRSKAKASMDISASQFSRTKQESTRTPSLSSSISTASSDSELVEPSGTDVPKPRHVVLYRSTSSMFPKKLNLYRPPLVRANEAFEEQLNSRNDALPMIVLTPPDDEDDYCTVSPFIVELFCPFTTDSVVHIQNLRVPTAPTFKSTEANSIRRKYPHPAGPWLRPHHTADLRVSGRSTVSSSPLALKRSSWRWKDGCRTPQGTVLGWEGTVSYFNKQYNLQNKLKKIATKNGQAHTPQTKTIHPAVAMFPPPRLPSEKEIQQRQLQFTIEQSLRLGRKVNRKRQSRHTGIYLRATQSTGDLK
ncbi:hypothetical protein PSTG_16559 [Puccinia striiformis f. sp. tritici PST-78]|uniref:Uncharacterized protein n=1 Tax=Puccinia striiformis f. sp. tritici PST-78 TaxID=1165861 RepID=A0A0L0USM5_9BASI|nr:hypothetical protein PSTG_16559 [Puccinia striiformis f. sp. tritici PST-78]